MKHHKAWGSPLPLLLLVIKTTTRAVSSSSYSAPPRHLPKKVLDGWVLPPPPDALGEDVGFLYMQGARIDADAYLPFAYSLQQAISETDHPVRLWVGLPHFPGDMASLDQMDDHIKGMKERMRDAGFQNDTFIYGGHSLGGAMIHEYVAAKPDDSSVKAVVMYGACLERNYTNTTEIVFPVPSLAVGGEKDGLMRVTRMAEAFYKTTVPGGMLQVVVVLPGVSHMQFASGEPPITVKELDLQPEVSLEDAHSLIANATADFVVAILTGRSPQAMPRLGAAIEETEPLVNPIIKALELEGSHHLRPPCNSDHPSPHCAFYPVWPPQDQDRTPSTNEDCTCGGRWVELMAQKHIGGLPMVTFAVVDAIHDVRDTNPYHHAHLWNNCTKEEVVVGDCTLNITTVSQVVYNPVEFDGGIESAHEIRAKMKSRQAIYRASVDPEAALEDTDTASLCAEINQMAWDWALGSIPPATRRRYERLGMAVVFGDDIRHKVQAGPIWINSPLSYRLVKDQETGEKVLEIRAPTMVTDVTASVYPDSAGYHYCKLLSPARAMEWIYVDGLRGKDSI